MGEGLSNRGARGAGSSQARLRTGDVRRSETAESSRGHVAGEANWRRRRGGGSALQRHAALGIEMHAALCCCAACTA